MEICTFFVLDDKIPLMSSVNIERRVSPVDRDLIFLPSDREKAITQFDRLCQAYATRTISGEEYFLKGIALSSALTHGIEYQNIKTVCQTLDQFLQTPEVNQAYQVGLSGEENPEVRRLDIHPSIGDRKTFSWWSNIMTQAEYLQPQAVSSVAKIVFFDKKGPQIIKGLFRHLSEDYSLSQLGVGISTLVSLRNYLAGQTEKSLQRSIASECYPRDLVSYYQSSFPPRFFYVFGLSQRIDEQMASFAAKKWGNDYLTVRSIVSAILFARTENVAPSPKKTGFGRFRSTKEVFTDLTEGNITSAMTKLKEIISMYPWYFHPHDVAAIYGSGRIDLDKLKKLANRRLKEQQGVSHIERPPTDLEIFREKIGQYPTAGTICYFQQFDEEGQLCEEEYLMIVTDPEGPSAIKEKGWINRFKLIEVNLTEAGSKARKYLKTVKGFVRDYFQQGNYVLQVLGKKKELDSNLNIPIEILNLMEEKLSDGEEYV